MMNSSNGYLIRLLVIFILLIVTCNGWSQAFDPKESQKIVPPSPTAAALGKYGEIPVSTYTGIPSIQIPLHQIKVRDIQLPIDLSYHAGGVKVEEEASWVGLGWSLNAGGIITRSTVGYDDLNAVTGFPFSYLHDPNTINSFSLLLSEARYNNRVDVEPDIFYFNVAGRSGKFVLNKDADHQFPIYGTVISQEKIQIMCEVVNTSEFKWTVILEDGTKYIFRTPEITLHRTNSSESGVGKPAPSQDPWFPKDQDMEDRNPDFEIPTAWYLDQIISPSGATVELEYDIESVFTTKSVASVSETRSYVLTTVGWCWGYVPTEAYSYSQTDTKSVYLKKITYPQGYMEFLTNDRDDLDISRYAGTRKPKKLNKINVVEGSLNKSFDFSYDYFNKQLSKAKRLRLESVMESSNRDGIRVSIPPHRFFYNGFDYVSSSYPENLLPSKDSRSRDHWGYYNGANNDGVYNEESGQISKTLIPSLKFSAVGVDIRYYGANRESSISHMKKGVLERIQYPTGGSTQFEFEANTIPKEQYRLNLNTEIGKKFIKLTNLRNSTSFFTKENTVVTLKGIVSCNCPTGVGCAAVADDLKWGSLTQAVTAIDLKVFTFGEFNRRGECSKVYNTATITLPPGNYVGFLNTINNYQLSLELSFDKEVFIGYDTGTAPPSLNVEVGGLRVNRVIDISENNVYHEKNFEYSSETDNSLSSGKLMTYPSYLYFHNVPIPYTDWGFTASSNDPCYGIWQTVSSLTSWSNVPLGASQGSNVGYSRVTIREGAAYANGKSIYTYLNNPYQVLTVQELPDFPIREYLGNGMPLKQEVFNASGFKLKEYVFSPRFMKGECVIGLKRRAFGPLNTGGSLGGGDNIYPYFAKNYCLQSEWWVNESRIERTYDLSDNTNTRYQEAVERFYFENPNHMQLTRHSQSVNGSVLVSNMTYPLDHTDGISVAMSSAAKHRHNQVITSTKIRQEEQGGNPKVVSKELQRYEDVSGKYLMTKRLVLENNQTLNPSDCPVSAELTYDANKFKLQESLEYFSQGNIKSITLRTGVTSYFWNSTMTLPLAKVQNAAPDQIYYTSFEEEGTIDSNSKTGAKLKLGSINIPLTSRPASGTYELTYWELINGAWTLKTQIINYVSSDAPIVNSNNPIDELRMAPTGAFFTTYFYDGNLLISQSDQNGYTTYYEYDLLGRLIRIKDDKKIVLKTFTYHYQLGD
ncbi:MAG: RHS repeat domain-containing protein [Cyclobacteriaceae bacterium]